MDRKLICGALVLLILQALLLFTDLGERLNWSAPINSKKQNSVIGSVIFKKQNVKRREQGSVIWTEPNHNDELFSYDAILTLENSTAQIKLLNSTQINLTENTLIVLEPIENSTNDRIRIRFNRGQFNLNSRTDNMLLNSENWEIDVDANSDISLKNLSDGQLELQVSSGAAQIKNQSTNGTTQIVESGTRLTFNNESVTELKKISQEMKFINRPEERLYSHYFPATYKFRWIGDAEKLRLIPPSKEIQIVSLDQSQTEITFDFQPGHYILSLQNKNIVSEEIILKVIEAPKIRYTSPLPRDRFPAGEKIKFSWLPLEGAIKYELQLTHSSGQRELRESTSPFITTASEMFGELHFRVFGEDELGFKIPPHYSQPVFILDDPFAPPKIFKPKVREPARENKKIDSSSNSPDSRRVRALWSWFDVFLPRASAESTSALISPEILFSWYTVQGADFYILEIATDIGFTKLELNQKVTGDSFSWKNWRKEKYYWRVAAGSNSGRMGIFSEPSEIDLTRVDFLKPGEVAPGVKIVKSAETKGGDKNSTVLDPNSAQGPSPINKAKEENSITEENRTPEISKVTPGYQMKNTKLSLNLHHKSYNFKNTFSAGLQGFASYSLELSSDLVTPDDSAFRFLGRYSQIDWEAEDSSALPFQEELSSQEYFLNVQYLRDASRDFHLGAHVESLVTLERADLEELKTATKYLVGPAITYRSDVAENMTFTSLAALTHGSSVTALSSYNWLAYGFSRRYQPLSLGANFDFKTFFGKDSVSGFYLTTGLHLSWQW